MIPTSQSAVPKVTVAMTTYNHEKFIAQAIESVLMQETNFPIELIIGEDCSTDGTREIVKQFAMRRPDIIRPIFQERNVGMHANGDAVMKACRGEYIACLEGDDYWTSPQKLQKQVDFLDRHPDHSICGTRFMNVDGDNPTAAALPSPVQKESGTLEDILRWNYLLTCSIVYRAALLTDLPPGLRDLHHGDMPRWVLLAQRGRIGYINEVMAAYRMHSGGVWIGASIETKIAALETTLKAIHNHLENRYPRIHRVSLCIRYAECAAQYTRAGDYANARRRLQKAFFKSPATFCASADARCSAMEQFRFYIAHPLKHAWGSCIGRYHRARIWAGANRRKLWKAITLRQHGANPGRHK
jgi:glycosyltransferase involved in cell wall biosynthesis